MKSYTRPASTLDGFFFIKIKVTLLLFHEITLFVFEAL